MEAGGDAEPCVWVASSEQNLVAGCPGVKQNLVTRWPAVMQNLVSWRMAI